MTPRESLLIELAEIVDALALTAMEIGGNQDELAEMEREVDKTVTNLRELAS